jgi:hypothetical protein
MASGVKLAGRQYRLLYVTREVAIVLQTIKGCRRGGMSRDRGGGLSCSSDESSVMEVEGLSLFSFTINDNQQWED